MSWKKVKLSQICDIQIGRTPDRNNSSYWGKGYSWVSIRDLKSDTVFTTKEEITDAAVRECNCKLIPANTLLMSFKLSIGKLAFTKEPVYTNEAIAALLIKDRSKVYNRFLYYALQVADLLRDTDRAVMGATLNKKKLAEIEIILPPLEEQKRIAQVLDKADRLRQKDRQLLQHYDQLLQSVFLDMFGDPGINSKSWNTCLLGDIIETLTDYHANGSYEVLRDNVTLLTTKNYALMVRTTDLENNNFTDNVIYIDEHAYNYLKKTKVYGGEIIINKIGSAGKVYLMPNLETPVSLGMNAFMLRFDQSRATSEFLYYYLTSEFATTEIQKRVKGAVTKTINKDSIREIPVLLPPLQLQEKFIAVIKKIVKQKAAVETTLKGSNNLFQSLLQKAFKGELQLKDEKPTAKPKFVVSSIL
ncbi:restriction endonuclease subunit S [Pontibacter locisalis]|uniref:Restriction endonuclease subunit S n=1 Tax=Pontibacter locisalis TaxID=1719035 RepID=A0ABW5ILB2_9BACT